MPGPLEGIKVVELGVWVAAPAAGGILADWGADVIKIEPPAGDPARRFGRMMQIESGVGVASARIGLRSTGGKEPRAWCTG